MARRSVSTVASNALKRVVAEANMHPMDPNKQLRALQALNQLHPNLVVERVENHAFVMSQEAQKEYMKALVNTSRIDGIDLNYFMVRMQGTSEGMKHAYHGQMNQQPMTNYGKGEAYTKFWAFFGTLAWGCIVVSSVKAFVEEQQHDPTKAPITHVGRELLLHLRFVDDDNATRQLESNRNEEELTTPYENVWDINME
ncbi:hypothetical protein THRCLA_09471 [Thraustotheca clavata]|uniref:Uncharacterized protein n=1 Tax=Thraustotheca clavata TaxID=74557 RepID=A0A1V9YWJ7_9STRA|nr:hypothetical protein THRCLA_09471 [Thraustotheca clavata]